MSALWIAATLAVLVAAGCVGQSEGDGARGGAPSGGGGKGGGGNPSGGAGPGGGGGGGPAPDRYRFNFEIDEQFWTDLSGSRAQQGLPPVRSSLRSFNGAASLEYSIATTGAPADAGAGTAADLIRVVGVIGRSIGPLLPGATVTFHLWVPAGHGLSSAQAFMQTSNPGSWHADHKNGAALTGAAWTEFTLVVPDQYAGNEPLELGFFFSTAGAWTGKIYVDAIEVVSR